jgi:apolipoprotein N-acyltransferase
MKTLPVERLLSIFAIVAWCGLPWLLVKHDHVGVKMLWTCINLFIGLALYLARSRAGQPD